LQRAAVAGGGIAGAAFLAACGGGTTTTGGGGANAPVQGGTNQAKNKVADQTKGVRGGKLIWQGYGDPGGGLELVAKRNGGVQQLAGLTHDGLLEFTSGTPNNSGMSLESQPNLAQAMPEISPDKLSYTFKLRDAKFHNGRKVVAEDAKYSFDRFAFGADSALKIDWAWLDSTQAVDNTTFVVKTKYPYTDALASMSLRYYNGILCKEHEESAEHDKKLLGSGPFLFVSYEPPLSTKYKRNPEYHRQPYPYFDEIERLGTSDEEKKIADFSSSQTHVTYWFAPESRDRVKKARPDAHMFGYPAAGSSTLYMRSDRPPFNDKRIRTALSMAINRKQLIAAVSAGEGEPDQSLSYTGEYWQFRKPAQLGANAKNWEYNVAEAKKLLAAAGVSLPMRFELPHWDPTVIGQKFVDAINMIQAQWKQDGIADVKDVNLTFGQASATISIGNYEAIHWGPNTTSTLPDLGNAIKNKYWSPPEGIKSAPTLNLNWVNNPDLTRLVEKQLGVFDRQERIATFRQIEDVLADNMYDIAGVSSSLTWFADGSMRNTQMPREAYNGATPYMKYWWFGKD
jgi:ABC-type transport system substrate-binding protein